MPTNKVRDAILDGLPAALKLECLGYLAAIAEEKRLAEIAKAAVAAQRQAGNKVYAASERIMPQEEKDTWPVGAVVFNIRNGRFYETVKPDERSHRSWARYRHLAAKTGRCADYRFTYCYGPKIQLPDSHPFVKKRANARLAERLEGKDV